jgi:hypothetical protein
METLGISLRSACMLHAAGRRTSCPPKEWREDLTIPPADSMSALLEICMKQSWNLWVMGSLVVIAVLAMGVKWT